MNLDADAILNTVLDFVVHGPPIARLAITVVAVCAFAVWWRRR